MASLWEAIQEIVSLSSSVRQLEQRIEALSQTIEPRLRNPEIAVARLEQAHENIRETVRAEVTAAIAELRIRYAEGQAQQRKKKRVLEE